MVYCRMEGVRLAQNKRLRQKWKGQPDESHVAFGAKHIILTHMLWFGRSLAPLSIPVSQENNWQRCATLIFAIVSHISGQKHKPSGLCTMYVVVFWVVSVSTWFLRIVCLGGVEYGTSSCARYTQTY